MRLAPIAAALTLIAALLRLSICSAAGEPSGSPEGELIVTDFSGKEHRLKSWKFVVGTRSLSWLAEPKQLPEKDKKDSTQPNGQTAAGPLALEFSEGKSTPLRKRVISFLMLEHLRAIAFDHKKELMSVRLAKNDKEADDEVLYGLTGYAGMNVFAIEALVDLGELGQAEVKFQGGVSRGVKNIRLSNPKPLTTPTGRPAVVTTSDRAKSTHDVFDLQPLYAPQDGAWRTLPTLFFQKTVKLDVTKIAKLSQVGDNGGSSSGLVYDVTLNDGKQHPLVLIERTTSPNGKPLFLEGLVGRTPWGQKLFPMAIIAEVQWDAKKP